MEELLKAADAANTWLGSASDSELIEALSNCGDSIAYAIDFHLHELKNA